MTSVSLLDFWLTVGVAVCVGVLVGLWLMPRVIR